MIEYDGETYLTATEIAQRFNISRGTCYSNILANVNGCYLPGRKNALYRQSDIERTVQVRIVEKPCNVPLKSVFPTYWMFQPHPFFVLRTTGRTVDPASLAFHRQISLGDLWGIQWSRKPPDGAFLGTFPT